MSFLAKYKSSKYFPYILVIVAFVFLFLAYRIYIWNHTQSTDNAYIEADISTIAAEVSGVLCEVLVEENSMVKQDQIIAKIKDDDYRAKYEKAKALFDGAKLDIEVIEQKIKLAEIDKVKSEKSFVFAETNLRLAQREYERTQKLSSDNYASAQKLDSAEAALEKAKNEFLQAKLSTQSSEEQLALLEMERLAAVAEFDNAKQETLLAQRALDNTLIRSPIDGTIGNSSLNLGNYIRSGAALFMVVPEKLYIKANFKETQISKFKPGMKAILTFDAASGYKVEGHIRNTSPATGAKFSLLPPANATGNFTKIVQRVPVVIDFTVPTELQGKLTPGMSTIVSVRTDKN